MTNASTFIHLWGPPGAGRNTALTVLTARPALSVLGDQDYETTFHGKRVRLRYSSFASKFYYRSDDPNAPPEFISFLNHLSKSDGVLFIADSQSGRRQHNIGWLERLRSDLAARGRTLDSIPTVFGLNKRDLPNVLSEDELRHDLVTARCLHVPCVARKGVGVGEALAALFTMMDDQITFEPST